MDSVNFAWFVTRQARRPITQYSWRIAHIEPTDILTYGVLMGFPLSIEGACQECSLACLPPDARRHMTRANLRRWLKYLYCDWVKNSMTLDFDCDSWHSGQHLYGWWQWLFAGWYKTSAIFTKRCRKALQKRLRSWPHSWLFRWRRETIYTLVAQTIVFFCGGS